VIVGEADGWDRTGDLAAAVGDRCPVADALVDVTREYIRSGEAVPVEAAQRHEGATAPGWLLAVAVVRPGRTDLVADTLELATAAGVPRRSLGACVAYIELAAGLFAGMPVESAVQAATGGVVSVDLAAVADPERAAPSLCGDTPADALTAGVWAVLQDAESADVMNVIRRLSTPGVAAAVAGLLGLRDGCGALPLSWHQGSERAAVCNSLAPSLIRSRCHGPARLNGGETERDAVTRDGRLLTSAGIAETGLGGEPATSVESGGWGRHAAASTGSSDWFQPEDRAVAPGALEQSHGSVSADAVTEETEAIEEQVPGYAESGVEEAALATTADEWAGRSAPRRQLEGAALR
jgi:hypothetical protein